MSIFQFVETGTILTFTLAVVTNVLIQRGRGIRAVVLSTRDRVLVALLFGWFGSIYVHGSGLAPEWFRPLLWDAAWARALGTGTILAGLVVGLLAYVHMGRSWRIGIDEHSDEELVTTGVFAWSRNPIYFFIDALAIGAALGSGSWWFVVSGVLVIAGVHVQVLREERFLERRYGTAYARYRGRTARYFGRLVEG